MSNILKNVFIFAIDEIMKIKVEREYLKEITFKELTLVNVLN